MHYLVYFSCSVIPGTIAWIDKLTWSSLSKFKAAKRTPVYPLTDPTKTNTGAFYQTYQNLAIYWILKAGHLVSCLVEALCVLSIKRRPFFQIVFAIILTYVYTSVLIIHVL